MKWKQIFQLSLIGLAMAFATVYWIPTKIEPIIWFVILLFCAYDLAGSCKSRYFLHGLLLGLAMFVWMTVIRVLFYKTYMANHTDFSNILNQLPITGHPRRMLALTEAGIGVVAGIILGLFTFIASKLVKKDNP